MNSTYATLCKKAVMHGPLESLFCCIGDPVIGNPTQLMMEATFESMLFPARYLTCTVGKDDLESAVKGIKALGFSGANVTAPHKVNVIQYLDGLTESAQLSGAVNCIIRGENDALIGDNTDGKGFLTAIEEIRTVEGMRVLVLGAGGAARAIITELALHGASHITIANRSEQKAKQIVETMRKRVKTTLNGIPFDGSLTVGAEYDLVVQATSVGLFDPEGGFDLTWEPKSSGTRIAADVVFNPIETQFLKGAEKARAICVDGLGMLVYQGAVGITNWTGRDANCTIMRSALEEAFTL